MIKQTNPAGQLHLFGQLDIWDCADDAPAAAPAPLVAHDFAGLVGHGSEAAASCSCGWESGLWRNAGTARKSHRAHQLEKAAAQGRADVAAGLDPFATIPGAHHAAERATGAPSTCRHCGQTVRWDHASGELAHTAR